MNYTEIIYTKTDTIATLRLNRPDNMNAFGRKMIQDLAHALKDAEDDEKIRVIILTGTGRAFCTGFDVKEMAKMAEKGESDSPESWFDGFSDSDFAIALQECPKPIIASLNGYAVGGGLEFALCCDIRIASDRGKFAELFVRRGVIPVAGGTYLLPRLVGIDKACEMIFTGEMINAQEAFRIGLVTKVVPHEELEDAVWDLAEKITKSAPLAVKAAKRAIYEGLSLNSLRDCIQKIQPVLEELYRTEDHKEGAVAFVEKREPLFKGK